MPIGMLSRKTGVNIETIRYYERIGLLPAPPRTAGGRRIYDDGHRRALAFIRRARELGFGLADIRALLALARPHGESCAQVERIASAHLDDVRNKLADLARLEHILAETVGKCARETAPTCPVLNMLDPG
ncbi:MerR family transcriptional regulator [Nitratireductor sp. CAU 1489]|uniref:MerR family transcriptional regulator n=2 Tax=Nitratireductor arenosus TaxID=2682096 RepID=A0A844QIH8_9HYPH|nr:helix-turn-helix domain-containing protein [Nitratireductor arenosus]MVA97780.1 MerR family transcriptional regulator [Nitratireductor arenosus]